MVKCKCINDFISIDARLAFKIFWQFLTEIVWSETKLFHFHEITKKNEIKKSAPAHPSIKSVKSAWFAFFLIYKQVYYELYYDQTCTKIANFICKQVS